jgi:hypothetical protein
MQPGSITAERDEITLGDRPVLKFDVVASHI